MQPVNAFFEERVAAGHRLVVAPVITRFRAVCDRREVPEHQFADDVVGDELAQPHRQRLVVIVFADEYGATSGIARGRTVS